MTMKSTFRALGISAALMGAVCASAWADDGVVASQQQLAALPVMQVGRAELPPVLTAADVSHYQRIFALQDRKSVV